MRYFGTAGVAAVVDLGGFAALLAWAAPVPAAAIASFLVANVVNYLLSARFAFGAAPSLRRYPMFLAAAGIGLAINVSVTWALTWGTDLHPLLAKTSGIGTAFVANFALNLRLVFPARGR